MRDDRFDDDPQRLIEAAQEFRTKTTGQRFAGKREQFSDSVNGA
jgi:hypothetical protein